jgi:hypothetical protein
VARSGSAKKRTTAPARAVAGRDYDALWQTHYRRALREGLSESMARFVARTEVHDQVLADRGLTRFGAGDIEAVY